MDTGLSGGGVLVTGAGQGIGRAIACSFAREGADVVIADLNLEAARDVAREVEMLGARALAVQVDVALPDSVRQAVEMAFARFPNLNVLVNNAGIQLDRSTVDVTAEEWKRVLSVDLSGAFYFCQQVARRWIADGAPGSIVQISSVAADFGFPRRVPYGVAKAGLRALTRALAVEWASHGIRVNTVAPGYVETEMIAKAVRDGHIAYDRIVQMTPLRRMARPEELADAVTFLASRRASFITGTLLAVDGGYSIDKSPHVGWMQPSDGTP